MQKNKLGFTLIELIIAISISSIISFLLFIAYYQTQKSSVNLQGMIFVDNTIVMVQNQLEKDITGAFVPNVTPSKQEKSDEQVNNKQEKEKQEKSQKQKPTRVILEKVFFSQNSATNLKELTFITCNPMQVYNQSNPRIARVIYSLLPDKQNPQIFTLNRQESNEIEYKKAKESAIYSVIESIRSMSVEFSAPEIQENQKDSKEKKEPKIIRSNEWIYKNGKNENIIPMFARVKISLWSDSKLINYQDFEFKYQIFAYDSQFERKSSKEKKFESLFGPVEELRKKAGIIDKEDKEDSSKSAETAQKQKNEKK